MHGNSIVNLSDNVTAGRAGAIYSEDNSAISYIGSSSSSETFVHNNTEYMVGPHTQQRLLLQLRKKSTITFQYNTALGNGGAILLNKPSQGMFTENASLSFSNNSANNYRGNLPHSCQWSSSNI